MIRTLFAKLRAEAAFLVLLAVAAAGAWLYVQLQQVRADRNDLQHTAEKICARAGADWAATKQAKRGVLCARRAAELATFKATADQETARLLAQSMEEANARAARDIQSASLSAARMRDALTRMENADAQAERRNLVDREWTAAVNGVAGLRAPGR
nr:hypothetical protein [uncultured Sphingomonas sp.]